MRKAVFRGSLIVLKEIALHNAAHGACPIGLQVKLFKKMQGEILNGARQRNDLKGEWPRRNDEVQPFF